MFDHEFNDSHHDGIDGVLDDAVPAEDVADQRRLARPEPTDDEQSLMGVGQVLDADPADVVDQRLDAPVIDGTEPWP